MKEKNKIEKTVKQNWVTKALSEHLDFTVKGLKTWATNDGGGYQGNLYYKGKKVAYFHNDGNGGETNIDYPDRERRAYVDFYCDNLKIVDGFKTDPEDLIAEVTDRTELTRSFKRKCKTQMLVVTSEHKEGSYNAFKLPYSLENKIRIIAKYPKYKDATYINELLEVAP